MRTTPLEFPQLLQEFFLRHLIAQRGASPATIASYRQAFELLFRFAQRRLGRPPSELVLADFDGPLVLDFLDDLEVKRGNAPRTRNARLAAIHSFARYASLRDPASLPALRRVLAVPSKRFDRPLLGYLTRPEVDAVLAAPDRTTWSGRRDVILLTLLYNTGARLSEITGLRVADVRLEREACVHLHGKGRKERVVPIWKSSVKPLRAWLAQLGPDPHAPVCPNRAAARLSPSGVQRRLQAAVRKAMATCPSLRGRRISPHTIRHTTAMHLLQAGIDLTVIALWLGHEDPATTHGYLEADLAMKTAALQRLKSPAQRRARFKPTDRVLAFLEGL